MTTYVFGQTTAKNSTWELVKLLAMYKNMDAFDAMKRARKLCKDYNLNFENVYVRTRDEDLNNREKDARDLALDEVWLKTF